MKRSRTFLKAGVFLLLLLLVFAGVNWLVKPFWKDWNNYDTEAGLYMEPKNRLEAVFVGASMYCEGLDSMRMYEDYGICAYSLATQQQPTVLSYYWAREAWRLHKETLKAVVMDVSMLRREPLGKNYRKGLEDMQFSPVKVEAAKAISSSAMEAMSFFLPFLMYHERWKTLDQTDWEKLTHRTMNYMRGYNFERVSIFDEFDYNDMPVPLQVADPAAEASELNEEALIYLDRMNTFCAEKGLKLVLLKTPSAGNWTSEDHHAVEKLAEQYDIDFLDFTVEPLLGEIGFTAATDSRDELKHINILGAEKLSSWVGRFLSEECGCADVREDPQYQYLKEQNEKYSERIDPTMDLKTTTGLPGYLEKLFLYDQYSAFVFAGDGTAEAFTGPLKELLTEKGLKKLTKQKEEVYCCSMIESGRVVRELRSKGKQKSDEGFLADKAEYSVKIGSDSKEVSIAGEKTEFDGNGVLIVLYDHVWHEVVDTAWFDPGQGLTKYSFDLEAQLEECLAQGTPFDQLPADLRKLYLYKVRCRYEQIRKEIRYGLAGEGPVDCLNAYAQEEDLLFFLAVNDPDAASLSDETKAELEERGFIGLENMLPGQVYAAAADGTGILAQAADGEGKVRLDEDEYHILCENASDSLCAAIEIDGKEFTFEGSGVHILVYDRAHKMAAGKYSF